MYKITIRDLKDFHKQEAEIYLRILEKVAAIINSDIFKLKVLNYCYTYKTGRLWWKKTVAKVGYAYTDDSPEQIYKKFIESDERNINEGIDYEADVYARMYYKNNGVVGKVKSGDKYLWINRKFFDVKNEKRIAANFAHEQTHRLGYKHPFFNTSTRKHSVPYAIGSIVKQLY